MPCASRSQQWPCHVSCLVFPDHSSAPVTCRALCSQITSVSQPCVVPCVPRSQQCPSHVSCLVFPDHSSGPVMCHALCSQITPVSQPCVVPCVPRSQQRPSRVSCLLFPDHTSVLVMCFMFPGPAHQWRCGYTLPGRNDCRSFPGEEKLSSLVMEKKRWEFFLSCFLPSCFSPSPFSLHPYRCGGKVLTYSLYRARS